MDDTAVAPTALNQAKGLLKLVRPKQWVKNGFVLAPLVFAGEFLDPDSISQALIALILFCLGSSATYIVNDLSDIEGDRRHTRKRKERPLASGQVKPRVAIALLVILYSVLVACWFAVPQVVSVIAVYLVLNVAYTFVLKQQPVLDIFTIAIGFVLRVYAGAMALAVPVSGWMFVTTLCLALYLAAVKRRQELSQSGDQARKVLGSYSVALIDRYAEMSATGALVFYSMYVMSSRPELVVTVPLVLFGLFRYWYIVEAAEAGESPTDALFSDWQLMVTVLLWVGACAWTLWPEAASL